MKNNFKAIATKTILAAAIASAVSGFAFAAEEQATNQPLTDGWAPVQAPAQEGDEVATSAYFTLANGKVTVNNLGFYGDTASVAGVEAKYDATNGLTIQGGSFTGFENVIVNTTEGKVTINDTQFRNNEIANKDADSSVIVVNANQEFVLDNVVFDGNKAGNTATDDKAIKSQGGAVSVKEDGTLTGTDVVFSNNWARNNGGAVTATGSVDFTDSAFYGNQSNGSGGALFLFTSKNNTFTDTDFDNNKAAEYGGAIRLDNGSATFEITAGKNFAYTGNTTGTTGTAPTRYLNHTGGFLYMQGQSEADFVIGEGSSLTIGTAGADTDSIASLFEADKTPTIKKSGAGDMIVHGDMSGFVGKVTVEGGSLVVDGGIGEYDVATQAALNKDGKVETTVGTTTLTVEGEGASLAVGDLNMAGNLAVNVTDGDFSAGNITVTKTTYKGTVEAAKDAKAELVGDVDFTIAEDQTANVESFMIEAGAVDVKTAGEMNVAGNVVLNGGNFTVGANDAVDGYVAINGDLQVLSGKADLGVDTDAKNVVIGKAKVGDAAATVGTVTVSGSLAADKITFASEGSTLKFNQGGELETSSEQIYSGTGDKVKGVTGYDFTNGTLVLTDDTFNKTKWDDLTTALGQLKGTGINYYFDTATYIAGADETITYETLNEKKHLGHAIVTQQHKASAKRRVYLIHLLLTKRATTRLALSNLPRKMV